MTSRLPDDSRLDIGALADSLSDTTNSYKFLWLLGLLECLPPSAEESPLVIRQSDIVREMLNTADFCLRRYRLNFGGSDRMREHIELLERAAGGAKMDSLMDGMDESPAMQKVFASVCEKLSRYVPQQWLTPFVQREEQLPQGSDPRAERIRVVAAQMASGDSPPPYSFKVNRRGADIVVHPAWHEYFARNRAIVRGWVLFKWINFLQSRNPNTPGIVAKIAQPERRGQLGEERKWWRAMIDRLGGVECIYSGERIAAADDFALDHYIPWSFVGHNRLWNLIPATENANSKKSDRLPSAEKYFGKFVGLHYAALSAFGDGCGGEWKDLVDSYAADLRVNICPPVEEEIVRAYNAVIPPLAALAESQGFAANWDYDQLPFVSAPPGLV